MEREENIGRKPEIPREWQIYEQWRSEAPLMDRVRGGYRGEWPEGTPPEVIEIETKTTYAEKILATIGKFPSFEAIQARTVEDVQRMKALEEQNLREMPGLTERERYVIRGRFGLDDGRPKTQAELAQEIGRSPRTVRRIEYGALRKMKPQL